MKNHSAKLSKFQNDPRFRLHLLAGLLVALSLGLPGKVQAIVGPCIRVVKLCNYPPNSPTCFPAGADIDFIGYVTNCLDLRLTNVMVVDCRPLLGAGLLDTNGFPLIQPLTLEPLRAIGFRGSFEPTLAETCAQAATNCITVRGTAFGASVTNSTTTACAICVNPCLAVTKVCSTNLVTLCNSNASTITFSGIVSNCGNIALTNVLLTDDLTGGFVLQLGSLAAGATAPWSAIWPVTAALCGRSNIVNTVTAIGANLCNTSQTVTNRASCSFSVACTAPSISITKACASPVVTNVGSSLTVTGQVCNTGNVPFDNVVVVDAQPSGVTPAATNNIGTLAPGQCKPYSFTYSATTCDPNRDTVTAIGTASSCPGAPSTATASATCFLCCPGISIQKLVACLLPGATCPPNGASYGPTATGVKGNTGDPTQDNPAFCYIIVVRNTGHDPLTNIVIHDDKLGALGTFPGPLAVGGTITISNLRTNWATTTTNTATVTAQCGPSGTSPGNGASVSASTNAVATVLQAGISCQKLVSVNGSPPVQSLTNDCSGGTNVITWYVTLTNTGEAFLCNIVVTELGIGPDLLPCGAVNIALTNCLAPGQGTGLIPVCLSVYGRVETNIENSIRVIGTVAPISNTCAINITGSNIVAESECRASVVLKCAPKICVTKEVVCELPTGCADNWASLAVGAKAADNSQCPSFCYRFRVTNCGGEALVNVTVLDDVLDLRACNFPTSLAVGQTVECIVSGVVHCDGVTNTVTATGVGAAHGSNTTASATAAVEVRSIAVTCNSTVNGQTNITIRCDGQPHLVTNAVEICNTGELPLADITIDAPELVALGGDCTNIANLRLSLLPGECTNVVVCADIVACQSTNSCGYTNQTHVTVTASVDATNVCSWTRNSSNQVVAVTASSSCDAVVVVLVDTNPPQVACRQGVNPSGTKIPVAGKNPASGQNPDGYYQLLGKDDCDPDPLIYLADTGSSFIAGPFHNGDVIKLTQSPGKTPSQDPAPAPIVAHLHFKGDGMLYAVDASGNQSAGVVCLVPRPPK